ERRLAAPRLADDTEHLARVNLHAHVVDRVDHAGGAEDLVVEREVLHHVRDVDQELAHRVTPSQCEHAVHRPGTTSSNGGLSWAHRSSASGQRGWNAQPLGSRSMFGGAPLMPGRRSSRTSMSGIARRSPAVYGCFGEA